MTRRARKNEPLLQSVKPFFFWVKKSTQKNPVIVSILLLCIAFILLLLYWRVTYNWDFTFITIQVWLARHDRQVLAGFALLVIILLNFSKITHFADELSDTIDDTRISKTLTKKSKKFHNRLLKIKWYKVWHTQHFAHQVHYLILIIGFIGLSTLTYTKTRAAGCPGTTSITANVTWSTNQCLGDVTISNGATVTINGGVTVNAVSLTLGNGVTNGFIIAKGDTVNNVGVTFNIDNTLEVKSGSSISANGQGYGPFAGFGQGGGNGGGAYGGHGGNTFGGSPYGLATSPTHLGSGGDTGNGGGAIIATVGGNLIVNGTISANGNTQGGSGGAINISLGSSSVWSGGASGVITANGGNGNTNVGGGSGGRISIRGYGSKTYTGIHNAYGGTAAAGNGASGTVHTKTASQTYGTVFIENNNITPQAGKYTHITNATPVTLDSLSVAYAATLQVPSGATLTIRNGGAMGVYGASTLLNRGTLVSDGSTDTVVGTLTLDGTSTLGNVTIQSGGVINHTANTNTATYRLNATANSMQIDSGGAINVNGLGFLGGGTDEPGTGTGAGGQGFGSSTGGGGGHAGAGGAGTGTFAGAGGGTYGSATAPITLGSGGGGGDSGPGRPGGGAIQLTVAGTLTINGSIQASGTNASGGTYGGGGGAGGSIYLTVGTIAGSGPIEAKGGNGGGINLGGGGGGGRIAVYINSGSTYGGTKSVAAGTGANSGASGSNHQPPIPPVMGATNNKTSTSLRWVWFDASSTETLFRVHDASHNLINTVNSTTTAGNGTTYTYTESGLTPNTAYTRHIHAWDGTYEGAASNSTTTYTLANVPDTPVVGTTTNTTTSLTFGENSNPSNTVYAIYESATNKYVQADGSLNTTAVWQTASTWGATTGIVVNGLTPNTTYTFAVKARNGDNVETALSSTANALTLASVPAAPTVTGTNSSTITVVINANGNPTATEYAIFNQTTNKYVTTSGASQDSEAWATRTAFGGNAGVAHTGLSENTNYVYKVKARNSTPTETAFSATSNATTPVRPTPPANITIKDSSTPASDNFRIELDWDSTNNIQFDYYIVERSTDNSSFSQIATPTTNYYIDTSVTPGQTYYYRLKTHTTAPDTSEVSETVHASASEEGGEQADTTAPVISNVEVTIVSDTKASLTWVTNEAATSSVSFGPTASYGTVATDTVLPTAVKRRHVITLTNLTPLTTYHYRVSSTDTSANVATGTDATFSTTKTPEAAPAEKTISLGEVKLSATSAKDAITTEATITWSSDEEADSFVEYGLTSSYGATQGKVESTKTHIVTLTGLQPNTLYHYRVRSTTKEGDVTVGTDKTFTTGTVTVPSISQVLVNDITLNSGLITWVTTKPSTTQIIYGTNPSNLDKETDKISDADTNHTVKLTGLEAGATYSFKVKSITVDSGDELQSNLFTFTTLSQPRVTSFRVTETTDTSFTVATSLNVATDLAIEYSTNPNFTESKQQGSLNQVKDHVVSVVGLKSNTTYYLRATARDTFGNRTTSGTISGTTLTDTFAPRYEKITAEVNTLGSGESAKSQALIGVNLNESAKLDVEYGIGFAPTGTTQTFNGPDSPNTSTVLVLSALQPAKTYHYRVVATDTSGNKSISDWKTFLTPESRSSVLQIIVVELSKAFGFLNFFKK